jgi:glycopeptide antibiotics resistance protein
MILQRDKLVHVIAGLIVFALVNLASTDMAIAAVLLAAFGKELVDWGAGKSSPDIGDVVATLIGGMIGYIFTV